MATVDVDIPDSGIIRACNTPGGPVHEFMDRLASKVENNAIRRSPVNAAANAIHRGGRTGTYKAGWRTTSIGSNGHMVRRNTYNVSGHSEVVEYGRSSSRRLQVFSWTAWQGDIRYIGPKGFRKARKGKKKMDREWGGRKTAARPGKHVLKNATNAALVSEGLAPGV
jgi:hypothetical protein